MHLLSIAGNSPNNFLHKYKFDELTYKIKGDAIPGVLGLIGKDEMEKENQEIIKFESCISYKLN